MKRPLSDKRPIGPFAQRASSSMLALVYTTTNSRDFPNNRKLEQLIENEVQAARQEGDMSEVVVGSVEVERIGDPRSDTRAIKVVTDLPIMNLEQFSASEQTITSVMEDQGDFTQVAVATSNP